VHAAYAALLQGFGAVDLLDGLAQTRLRESREGVQAKNALEPAARILQRKAIYRLQASQFGGGKAQTLRYGV
jgi:hypothetical protein